ncbi:MAG: amidohydrolase family protein [Gammaproteobacteria bacterium]|nr:amidohydrolase family protein [Gammaproteobacteria bacterium]
MRTTYIPKIIVSSGLILFSISTFAQQATSTPADTIFFNANVLTVDSDAGDFTVAEGLAIRDGIIQAVGSDEQVRRLAGPQTRQIDLDGKTVMPGLIDTHTHPTQYAGYRTAPEVAPEIAATHMIEGPRLNLDMSESVRLMLGQLRARVRQDLRMSAEERPWLTYLMRSAPGDADYYFYKAFDRYDLDKLSPNRPMLVDADGNLMVNSAGLEDLREKVPLVDLDPELDSQGVPTGRLGPGVRPIISAVVPDSSRDFFPGKDRLPYSRRIELLARSLRAELRDHWATYGITTIASKLDAEEHAAMTLLDQHGEMPVRWAYHIESFRSPMASEFMARQMPNYQGYGTPFLWMAGIYGGSADSFQCTTLPSTRKQLESCNIVPGGELWHSLFPALRSGFRISGFHVHGDLAVDYILLLIEQASAAGGMTLEDIRAKRHVLDHCAINPRADQIERGKRLGITWTCGPKYIIRAHIDSEGYDPEAVSEWVVPMRSLIDAGLKPGLHTDGDQGGPMMFTYMQTAITRKDLDGRTWNAAEAVDRKEVLRAATRWNALNILKGDELGSIEVGKWADVIVIDSDYLSIPVEQIANIRVLMTVIGGEIVYHAND